MRIAYVAAGAAGMYCGSCLHDNTLAAALMRLDQEVALVPTYTPLRTDEADVSIHQVFYGAINVYLQDRLAFFRHTPRLLDWLLDRPRLLSLVSRFAGSTDGKDLGALTLSIVSGEDGHQQKEVRRLVAWLATDYRPDIVHLTNSMFLGLAAPLKRELGVPVVCSLQGEDLFFDQMPDPYRGRVLAEIRRRADDVDLFLSTSDYYSRHMAELFDLPSERFRVVRLGIQLDDYLSIPTERPDDRPFTVGYLARLAPEKGLHLLVDAFHLLTSRPGGEQARLRVAGYLATRDRGYVEELVAKLQDWGLADRSEILGEVDRDGKRAFLSSIDVLAVPTVYAEPKGLFALEAMASGVSVVLPAHGAFPEMIAATGGGLLVEPHSAAAVADALHQLAADPAERRRLGAAGRAGARLHASDRGMAEATLAIYHELVGCQKR